MKSFKHIISYACDKNCSYCINEILTHSEKQCKDNQRIASAYQEMSFKGYDHIMLSGGEPVLNKMFNTCLGLSSMFFDHISIISAHKKALEHRQIDKFAHDILFSLHAEYLDDPIPQVNISIPVYASMIVETYDMLRERHNNVSLFLKEKGFAGMTIRECYPDGKELSVDLDNVDEFEDTHDFTVRIHKKNNCVKESILLLPDLSTTTEKEFA